MFDCKVDVEEIVRLREVTYTGDADLYRKGPLDPSLVISSRTFNSIANATEDLTFASESNGDQTTTTVRVSARIATSFNNFSFSSDPKLVKKGEAATFNHKNQRTVFGLGETRPALDQSLLSNHTIDVSHRVFFQPKTAKFELVTHLLDSGFLKKSGRSEHVMLAGSSGAGFSQFTDFVSTSATLYGQPIEGNGEGAVVKVSTSCIPR